MVGWEVKSVFSKIILNLRVELSWDGNEGFSMEVMNVRILKLKVLYWVFKEVKESFYGWNFKYRGEVEGRSFM